MSVWKSDETLLSICILNFSFKNDFVWEEISNIRHSVSSPDETPRSSSKILRCASYFQLSSRCFIWWWNTASHVWYITWKSLPFRFIILRCDYNIISLPTPWAEVSLLYIWLLAFTKSFALLASHVDAWFLYAPRVYKTNQLRDWQATRKTS